MERSINFSTLLKLTTLLYVLSDELLLVEEVCLFWGSGRYTGVGMSDEGNWADERVLNFHQDNPKVNVLAPSVGTLDQCLGLSEETMRVSDGRILQFPWLLGESWV